MGEKSPKELSGRDSTKERLGQSLTLRQVSVKANSKKQIRAAEVLKVRQSRWVEIHYCPEIKPLLSPECNKYCSSSPPGEGMGERLYCKPQSERMYSPHYEMSHMDSILSSTGVVTMSESCNPMHAFLGISSMDPGLYVSVHGMELYTYGEMQVG